MLNFVQQRVANFARLLFAAEMVVQEVNLSQFNGKKLQSLVLNGVDGSAETEPKTKTVNRNNELKDAKKLKVGVWG